MDWKAGAHLSWGWGVHPVPHVVVVGGGGGGQTFTPAHRMGLGGILGVKIQC